MWGSCGVVSQQRSLRDFEDSKQSSDKDKRLKHLWRQRLEFDQTFDAKTFYLQNSILKFLRLSTFWLIYLRLIWANDAVAFWPNRRHEHWGRCGNHAIRHPQLLLMLLMLLLLLMILLLILLMVMMPNQFVKNTLLSVVACFIELTRQRGNHAIGHPQLLLLLL